MHLAFRGGIADAPNAVIRRLGGTQWALTILRNEHGLSLPEMNDRLFCKLLLLSIGANDLVKERRSVGTMALWSQERKALARILTAGALESKLHPFLGFQFAPLSWEVFLATAIAQAEIGGLEIIGVQRILLLEIYVPTLRETEVLLKLELKVLLEMCLYGVVWLTVDEILLILW